ncbi:MAG: peptidoglycan DD-metalloendopeptidase family protein [Candidatus Omnitrophica bacterium]|nr:peptidoglycan DD-metalloendopeptidase family protein [Candidatus Omnitrophota bacterium]
MPKIILFLLFLFFLGGCAGLDKEGNEVLGPKGTLPMDNGIYHKVGRGETLWTISQKYNVVLGDIVRVNNIPNVAKIEMGQLVFIPGATDVKEQVSSNLVRSGNFNWPVRGKVISFFRERKGNSLNRGIDIEAEEGSYVNSSREGKVVLADFMTGYGNTVILEHHDGYYSVYANNSKLLVKLGDKVKENYPIAFVGTKNNLSFLHFEIRNNSREENPLFYLP